MFKLKKLYDWLGKQVHTPYATSILGALFFIEAIFFIPVDPLLILFCIENRKKALYYATVATLCSVAGGLGGYGIGYLIWEKIGTTMVALLFSPEKFTQALGYFREYEAWAVLIAGFTPFPYKLITLGAGFCKLPVLPFVFYSLLSRGARFYLIAFIIKMWGVHIKKYIDQYFDIFVGLFTVLLLIVLWCML